MSTVATLNVKLGLDSTAYKSGLASAQSATKSAAANMSKNFKNVGASMMKVGGIATVGLTLPIVAGLGKAVGAASDLEESINAVNTVFGEGADIILEFGENSAVAVGLSESEFGSLAATAGALLQNLGFTAEGAADATLKLATRASDMASVFNTDVDQALAAVQSALKGEFNPLEQFGVKMNQAAINAKALELGLGEMETSVTDIIQAELNVAKAQEEWNKIVDAGKIGTDEAVQASVNFAKATEKLEKAQAGNLLPLSDNAKAQAALALLYEQTDRIAGDFANTSDGLANSQRILKAQLTDVAAQIGNVLLPFVTQIVQWISELTVKFQTLSPAQQQIIVGVLLLVAAIGPLLLIFGSLATAIGAVIPIIATVAGILIGPVGLAIAAVVAGVALLVAAWKNDFGGMRTALIAFWEGKVKPAFDQIVAFLKVFIPAAITAVVGFWENSLLPALQAVWGFIETSLIPLFMAVANVLAASVGKGVEALAGLWQNVLLPVLKIVWSWFIEKLMPILEAVGVIVEWLANVIFKNWATSFEGIVDAIKAAVDWLKDLAESISNLELPAWLTPGSPTPFELGLKGIAKELKNVTAGVEIGFSGLPDMPGSNRRSRNRRGGEQGGVNIGTVNTSGSLEELMQGI